MAFFIYIAASGEVQQTTIKAAFENVTVADVMTPKEKLQTVTKDITITDLITRMFSERHVGYPVLQDGTLVGMVTLDDAADVNEVEQDAYRVEDVMTTDIETITPGVDAMEALQRMQQSNVGRLPVVDDAGNPIGIISRTDLMRAFNVIQTSGLSQAPLQSDSNIGAQ